MDKKLYVLVDASGEVFDTKLMDAGELQDEQDKAVAFSDGTFWWTEPQS